MTGNVGPRRSEVTAACETTGDEGMWEAAAGAACDNDVENCKLMFFDRDETFTVAAQWS